jgi:hypothetical protein
MTGLFNVLAVAGLALATSSQADTLYDNLTPGVSSAGVASAGNLRLYDSFSTSSSSETLNGVQLDLSGLNAPGTLTVALFGDSSTAPGTLIANLGTISDSSIGSGVNDYTLSLSSTPLLAADTRYWIGLSDNSADTVQWSYAASDAGTGVSTEYNDYIGGVSLNSAFTPYQMQITATPSVPDAGLTASLLGLGFSGLLALRRKLA